MYILHSLFIHPPWRLVDDAVLVRKGGAQPQTVCRLSWAHVYGAPIYQTIYTRPFLCCMVVPLGNFVMIGYVFHHAVFVTA